MPLVPPQPSYPGVYVQEVPGEPGPIPGVATSITAFLGRTVRGPANRAVSLFGFQEFIQWFGGLSPDCPLTYAVRDFFQAGGTQAVVVRLADGAPATVPVLAPGAPAGAEAALTLSAVGPGEWGNALRVVVDHAVRVSAKALAIEGGGVAPDELFNLTVTLEQGVGAPITEAYEGVTLRSETARSLRRALASSRLLGGEVSPPEGAPRPPEGSRGQGAGGTQASALPTKAYLTEALGEGFQALNSVDLINLICVPPDDFEGFTGKAVYGKAVAYAATRRAFVIVDAPYGWDQAAQVGGVAGIDPSDLGVNGDQAHNAAVYFPRVRVPGPERDGTVRAFPVSGMIAGLFSRTDAERGVWKAPAGISARLSGVEGLTYTLSDAENGELNAKGISCLRTFPGQGTVVWGARTLAGADEYKYVPVRRTALYIEESLYRGTQWAVFEPNDEPLWAQLRRQVGAFMDELFRQGAFQGASADQAYFVRCDSSTTTQADIEQGVVNVVVGFAPLKPAEFVVLSIQQKAGADQ